VGGQELGKETAEIAGAGEIRFRHMDYTLAISVRVMPRARELATTVPASSGFDCKMAVQLAESLALNIPWNVPDAV
jgi:hypothetical protein